MTHGPRYNVKPRRRREGVTDYRKRLKLLKSRKVRLVIRKSIKNTLIQMVEYKEGGDHILASANSKELVNKYQWNFSTSTTPAANLTGILVGSRANKLGIKECVLDTGLYPPVTGSKIFASVKGVVEAGINCPYDKEKLPDEDRLTGKHLNKEIIPAVNDIKNKIIGGK